MTEIKIPRAFWDDHRERNLPTPIARRSTRQYVWINADDPTIPDLLSDAAYYVDPIGLDGCENICRAARRLLCAIGTERERMARR